eukprot:COSAG01_NODE_31657_length_593_cov_1.619433_2_plen_97_part_01
MLMIYFASSVSGLMILVQRATCRACSSCIICLSAARSHKLGGPRPVSDSLMPVAPVCQGATGGGGGSGAGAQDARRTCKVLHLLCLLLDVILGLLDG